MIIAFLGVISFVVFVIFGIMLLRKKGRRKRNFLIAGISFLLLIVLVAIDPTDTETTDDGERTAEKDKAKDKKSQEKQNEKDKKAKEKQDKIDKEEQDEKDKKDKEKQDQEAKKKKEKREEKKEHRDLSFAEYSLESITSKIEDDTLKLRFIWINQSGYEAHYTVFGYFDVRQGDEVLKESSGVFEPMSNSLAHRKTPYGVSSPVDAEYKLINDEPIEILFGSWLEEDKKKETITIEVGEK